MKNLKYIKLYESWDDGKKLPFSSKINTIHTDIQLLSGKLNYKK